MQSYSVEAVLKATGAEQFKAAFDGAVKSVVDMEKTSKRVTDMGSKMMKSVSVPIVGAFTASVKYAHDFETAMTGVKKTTDLSTEKLAAMSNEIKMMSRDIPVSALEIANIVESAGQLGIAEENLLGFSRVMADLGVATNMSSEQAATALARFANITGMAQTDFDRLGSTIVSLGNSFATTESEIVDMAMRLAGAGSQIGLTEAEIIGMSTALSSVGIASEAGGSAFSKVMIEMQLAALNGGESLAQFASVAGMSSDEFATAFGNNAAGAIAAFVQGLGSAEEKGLSAIGILDEMGITEVRMRDALLRSGEASEMFAGAMDQANTAFGDNVALTNEAEAAYDTAANKIQIMKNALNEMRDTVGSLLSPYVVKLADGITKIAHAFEALPKSAQSTIVAFLGVLALVGPVTWFFGKTLGGIVSLGKGVKGFGGMLKVLFGGITKAGTIVGGFGKTLAGISATVKATFSGLSLSGGVMKAFGLAFKGALAFISKPAVIATLAIAGVIGAIWLLAKHGGDVFEALKSVGSSISTFFSDLFANTSGFTSFFGDLFKTIFGKLPEDVRVALTDTFNIFKDMFNGFFVEIPMTLFSGISEAFKNSDIVNHFTESFTSIKETLSTALDEITGGMFSQLADPLKTGFEFLSNDVAEFLKGFFSHMTSLLTNTVGKSINDVFRVVVSIAQPMMTHLMNYITGAIELILNLVGHLSKVVSGVFKAIIGTVVGLVSAGLQTLSLIFGVIVKAISLDFDSIGKYVTDGVHSIGATFASVWDSLSGGFMEAGRGIIEFITEGITGGAPLLWDTMKGVLGTIRDMLPFSPPKDKTSPLMGIDRNGIGTQIAAGILRGRGEVDAAMRDMLDSTNVALSTDINTNSGTITNKMAHELVGGTMQPATINLQMGNQVFSSFVDDITNAQDRKADLDLAYR